MSADPLSFLPEAFVARLDALLTPTARAAVAEAFTHPAATSFRVNTLRAIAASACEALRAEGLAPQPVPWYPDAFWVPPSARAALLASAPYRNGLVYVQNLASMVPPLVLAPQPEERVLDLTAAPGSKTLQMACMMEGTGELAAVEVVKNRFFKLRANLAAQGADHVRTFLKDGTRVWRYRPDYFDRVLLDAPCSSEGRFHQSHPDSYAYWSPRKIKEMNRKQRRLLYSAVRCLRPGGTLVYSTCTFAPEENEAVIDHALGQFGDALRVVPIDLPLANRYPARTEWLGKTYHPDLVHAVRLLPGEASEAFFVCKLHKPDA